METFVEVLYKSADKLTLGWTPEPEDGVKGYKLYVGQVSSPSLLTLLVDNISAQRSNQTQSLKKVSIDVESSEVQSTLSLPDSLDFSNLLLYFAITYIDSSNIESLIAESTVVEVPPVGINGKTMREDPTVNRHLYGFSDELQKWNKVATSGRGAVIIDTADFYKTNTVTEYTRDGSGNVLVELTYFTDRTTTGSPAKLISYEYSGDFVSKVIITDSTVP